LVKRLCAIHESANRTYLCLFYDNPSAGAIYRGIGFLDAGIWVMGTPPARI
jgi:predicted GNAT family acetyltransferase